ncbi:type IV secretion system DNA-binding domain-containing protein [Bordetella sp. FB-8]|uniref:type IV secretion system DNA-binding domain-containing protein n=1 Tax=Bordetella sp. FB-8 TaxID=1159870 RepID=UPI00037A30D3|nr:type IV secretion system DNA-binding domain-containing protein [Bordetella sp. FB-8]
MTIAPDTRRRILKFALIFLPFGTWLLTAMYLSGVGPRQIRWPLLSYWILATPRVLPLIIAPIVGLVQVILLAMLLKRYSTTKGFDGAGYKRHIRGTQIIPYKKMVKKCREKKTIQVDVAGVPMPTHLENLHLLINGATGTGKSVLMRALILSLLKRGDRAVIVDPDGALYRKFGRPGDIILNPYDTRTQGWMFFNEVRADYDWKRLGFSVVPLGQSAEDENWNGYGRLLLRAVSRKLFEMGIQDIGQVIYWCCEAPFDDIRAFLTGTEASSLFAGASESTRAFDSARFVLSKYVAEHRDMPNGDFSITDWLENGTGCLYITWKENMKVAMRPLISCWVDVFCSSFLSLQESQSRRFWLLIDELASMEKLATLQDALTKGRKYGLRVVAGLQTVAQIVEIYKDAAKTLLASFRSLVVLGGARTDQDTAQAMSKALGEHEVERPEYTDSRNAGRDRSTSERMTRTKEPVVMDSDIQGLKALTGYVGFAESELISKFTLTPIAFINRNEAFVETESLRSRSAAALLRAGDIEPSPWDMTTDALPSDPTQV